MQTLTGDSRGRLDSSVHSRYGQQGVDPHGADSHGATRHRRHHQAWQWIALLRMLIVAASGLTTISVGVHTRFETESLAVDPAMISAALVAFGALLTVVGVVWSTRGARGGHRRGRRGHGCLLPPGTTAFWYTTHQIQPPVQWSMARSGDQLTIRLEHEATNYVDEQKIRVRRGYHTRLEKRQDEMAARFLDMQARGPQWRERQTALRKAVHVTSTAPFFVATDGRTTVAGFGGPRTSGVYHDFPEPTSFAVMTDSVTEAVVRGITLVVDALVLTDASDVRTAYVAALFNQALTALRAGTVTVECIPFPRPIPVADLQVVAGMQATGLDVPVLTADTAVSHARPASVPAGIWLPVASQYRVLLNVPNCPKDKAAHGRVVVLTGLISILQENRAWLGAVGPDGQILLTPPAQHLFPESDRLAPLAP